VVAVSDGRVIGYACSSRFRHKAAYETSVETSIYLAPESVGRGAGSRLYEELFETLEGDDVHRAYAGIALPNPASVALHERFGFKRVAHYTEQGRKFGRYWDVAWYERPLGGFRGLLLEGSLEWTVGIESDHERLRRRHDSSKN
jgi:phosphinothricin acetyltransferase